ncbi:hypothetical protein BDQ17DRAFT_1336234 [Cyathus striatus]|nr:hypothetical protein BDQ17DRAFT_1336234 [Cyathus striatus]
MYTVFPTSSSSPSRVSHIGCDEDSVAVRNNDNWILESTNYCNFSYSTIIIRLLWMVAPRKLSMRLYEGLQGTLSPTNHRLPPVTAVFRDLNLDITTSLGTGVLMIGRMRQTAEL